MNESREHRVEVTRGARIVSLGGRLPASEVWYLLHGYGQLARRFMRRFRPFARDDRLLVAPEALSRFYPPRPGEERRSIPGASWMTREDREREIADYLAYLDRVAVLAETGELPSEEPSSLAASKERPSRLVLGFSQGAHTAARWVALGEPRFDRVVLWGAALPPDLPDDAASLLSNVDLVLVRGATDELRRPEAEEREETWLRRRGVPYRVVSHPGGHEIARDVLEEIVASPGP